MYRLFILLGFSKRNVVVYNAYLTKFRSLHPLWKLLYELESQTTKSNITQVKSRSKQGRVSVLLKTRHFENAWSAGYNKAQLLSVVVLFFISFPVMDEIAQSSVNLDENFETERIIHQSLHNSRFWDTPQPELS